MRKPKSAGDFRAHRQRRHNNCPGVLAARGFECAARRLPVEIDAGTQDIVFHTTQALCRKHGLTTYDAAYLEIAIRGVYPLATADEELKAAAIAEGVQVL
jgi:predicted nucleic acid-binding protein